MGFFSLLGLFSGCNKGLKPNRANTTDEITKFEFNHSGMSSYDCYSFACKKEGEKALWEYECCGTEFQGEVAMEDFLNIQKVFAENKVANWNGFSGTNSNVLDGSGYSLSVTYADGSTSDSSGSNKFPSGYSNVHSAVADLKDLCVKKAQKAVYEQQFSDGKYEGEISYLCLTFIQKGTSGSDSYEITIYGENRGGNDVQAKVHSTSGEFLAAGDYEINLTLGDTSEIRKNIGEIFTKYEVGRWDGWDSAHEDYNNNEWFQITASYPEVSLNCYGSLKPDHYDEVRKEVLSYLAETYK